MSTFKSNRREIFRLLDELEVSDNLDSARAIIVMEYGLGHGEVKSLMAEWRERRDNGEPPEDIKPTENVYGSGESEEEAE